MRRNLLMLLGAGLLVTAACGGDEEAEPAEQPDTATEAQPDTMARIRAETEEVRGMIARRVHFDFDRAAIRPGEDTRVLEQKAAILEANPNLTLEIVGHCDERGSNAYNMRLGQRRADAAKRFLTQRGIAGDRITTRSRGEEEPVDPGHNEQAWAQNRRVEFRVTGGGDRLTTP